MGDMPDAKLTDEQLDEIEPTASQFHYEHCSGVGRGGAWTDCDCTVADLVAALVAEVRARRAAEQRVQGLRRAAEQAVDAFDLNIDPAVSIANLRAALAGERDG